jgi:hypothetical protein
VVASHAELSGKIILPAIISETEFSGLDNLEKSNSAYPEISVTELQNIAVNRCRLGPSEVTVDLLLVSREKADGVNGDKSKLEVTRMSHG